LFDLTLTIEHTFASVHAMPAAAIVALVMGLVDADPARCDRDGLAQLVQSAQRVRGWLDALDARIALRATRLAEPAAALLAGDGRRSAREAQVAAERATACELMPSLHDALADGEVSAGHADAVARIVVQLGDAARVELAGLADSVVASARRTSVEEFGREMTQLGRLLARDEGVSHHERLRRQRSLTRWLDRQTGMCHTRLVLDPEADAKVAAVLDSAVASERARAETDDRSFEQLRADAFVGLLTGARGDRRVPEVSVLIDLPTLVGGLHDDSVAETADGHPLPPATIRRLACTAELIPVVLDGRGVSLDVGRSRRVATPAQRTALRSMYRTCAHPACTVRFGDCDIHHVLEWTTRLGPTALDNLLPLCSRHHHMVHEGGWRLTLRPDRTITLRRPDGTVAFEGTTVDVAGARAPAA
jgi:hypothetical protein